MLLIPIALASLTASPSTYVATLGEARCGDVVTFVDGDYGTISAPQVNCGKRPVVLDLSAVRASAVVIRSATGVIVRGGRIRGSGQGAGVVIDRAVHVSVRGVTVGGSKVGVTVVRSTDVEVADNVWDGVQSDGVTIAMAQRVLVARNICRNFNPVQAVYDAAGKLVKDGDHPDCVQGWSVLGTPPTADITIEDNVGEGFMQGVWFGNPGQGGYDRIVVRNNRFRLSAWNGIAILEGRDSVITGNRITTIPGAKMNNFPFKRVKTWIYTKNTTGRICGNVVTATPGGVGTKSC